MKFQSVLIFIYTGEMNLGEGEGAHEEPGGLALSNFQHNPKHFSWNTSIAGSYTAPAFKQQSVPFLLHNVLR